MIRSLGLLLAALLAACATASTEPSGPIVALDMNFPDPAVIRAPDGYYYAYATQGEVGGRMINIQVARSRDLVSWEHLGDALPAKPAWAAKTQDFWAPDVSEHDGRYLMYYSAKPDAALDDSSRGLCLAVASAPSPRGPFTDMGRPLICGESFVNIDPMAFDDPATGRALLYWGSGFGPIKVQELAPDRTSFAEGSTPVALVDVVKTDDPANYRRLVEGAWVVRRDGWYYLFFSGDNCCGPKAHYAVMVARSRSALGPFEIKPDRGGVILEASPGWVAPGHNSTIEDDGGRTWILYHAVDVNKPMAKPTDEINTRRIMLVDKLVWKNGWPEIDPGK
ncbi:glycoside hydrolase family 43 protein [Tsuneonella sp. HG249]